MSKSLQWELDWIDAHPECYEGPLHRELVKRNITARYLANQLIKGEVAYTLNPEKRYKYLGISHGAGVRGNERLFVYWDHSKGQLFHREREDFNQRMRQCR